MPNVTIDGATKVITVNSLVTALDVKEDLYSYWKDWVLEGDNSKYLIAFTTSGGEEISTGVYVGSYFFLENGWKIKPYEGDHRLTITGNLYTRDGTSPFIATTGSYNVSIETRNSNLSTGVSTSVVAVDPWESLLADYPTAGTMGKRMNELLTLAKFLGLK